MNDVTLLQGDCIETLKTLPEKSVQTCVTSPPYYGLRDYGTAQWSGGDPECDHKAAKMKSRYDYPMQEGSRHAQIAQSTTGTDGARWKDTCPTCGAVRVDDQIGLEPTPEQYVARMVEVFREVRRVLKDDGTVWLNLGDSYAGSGKGPTGQNGIGDQETRQGFSSRGAKIGSVHGESGHTSGVKPPQGYKAKDLFGIPWMVAFALRADGWYLRSEIIWHKPNPMPESVTDRPTKSHEQIFLLSKSAAYYYDAQAIMEPTTGYDGRKDTKVNGGKNHKNSGDTFAGREHERWPNTMKNLQPDGQLPNTMHKRRAEGLADVEYPARNKRSVWTIATKPYPEAHFATFPPELIEPCILAGSRAGDTVLDPFNGSGTTGAVSLKHHRKYIGCELKSDYIQLTYKRLSKVQPVLFPLHS